jgi:hypothetical protein
MNQSDNDSRVTVELDLENDLLFELMLEAHRQDTTLNKLIEKILREFVEQQQTVIKGENDVDNN